MEGWYLVHGAVGAPGVTDLEECGLLDDVAILMGGEMGRSPKISGKNSGRDHWPQTGITIMAGCGLKTGQVVGARMEYRTNEYFQLFAG